MLGVGRFTANPPITEILADVAQLVERRPFQAGGHGFEACRPLLFNFTELQVTVRRLRSNSPSGDGAFAAIMPGDQRARDKVAIVPLGQR